MVSELLIVDYDGPILESGSLRYDLVTVGEDTSLALADSDLASTRREVVADPELPDLDGDEIPESISIDAAAPRHCQEDLMVGCMECGIPGGRSMRVLGSGGQVLAGPFPADGRNPNEAFERFIASHWVSCAESFPACCDAALGHAWTGLRRFGQPTVRTIEGGFVTEVIQQRFACDDWCWSVGYLPTLDEACTEAGEDRDDRVGCRSLAVEVVRYTTRGGTTERSVEALDDPRVLTLRASCGEACRMSARPWDSFDGVSAPHRVHLDPEEIYVSEQAPTGADGLRLHPGVHLVSIQRGEGVPIAIQVRATMEEQTLLLDVGGEPS